MIQGGFVTVDLAEKYIEIHNTKAETKDHVQKWKNIRKNDRKFEASGDAIR